MSSRPPSWSGYGMRVDQARQRAGERPCPSCGHPVYRHREYQDTWELVDGELVKREHPRHRAGLFHCEVDDCDCEVQA